MLKTKTDIIYLAGLIDGEGSFTAATTTAYPHLTIAMTDYGVLKWVSEIFGGRFLERKISNNKWGNKKRVWEWHLHGQSMCELVEEIVPYLKVKRKQALACWKLATVKGYFGDHRPGVRGHQNPNIKKFYAGVTNYIHSLNNHNWFNLPPICQVEKLSL